MLSNLGRDCVGIRLRSLHDDANGLTVLDQRSAGIAVVNGPGKANRRSITTNDTFR
jgi:hypothetical protein